MGMKLNTTRFGTIEVDETRRVRFVEGLLGFSRFKLYMLIPHGEGGMLWWLQSEEVPELAFLLCDPRGVFPDYQVAVAKDDLTAIGAESPEDCDVWVILNVNAGESQISANLKGPIALNRETRLAKQLVLTDEQYGIRHPLIPSQEGA